MRFRLLKYMCRIWDESFKEQPEQLQLRLIVPLVFYQGKSSWRYSTEFADLFGEDGRDHVFIPRFAHLLIDQSGLSPEQIQGGLKAQVAQLLMMAAYHEPVRALLDQAAKLLAQVAKTGGIDYVSIFVVYLVATQERRIVQEFAETVRRYETNVGGAMLTYAEELRQEGRQEGEQKGRQEGRQEGLLIGEIKGKIETIENLLAVDVDWKTITIATGIDPARFQELKAQLQTVATDTPPLAPQLNESNTSSDTQ
ncbi:MAG: Rpn family recombination-promoting nuclease/putative transposase [Caldilineaceae bacterium]|nr:Rpn family recombination-promoting nuclease/putative transposase [Caldilineaceae bacterium]